MRRDNPDDLAPVEPASAGASTGQSSASDTRQFVTFMAGDEVFAVEMAPVQEIIRVPEVVRVPLSPPTLEGLSNLRGKVLPIVSLRRVLGLGDRAHDDTSRAVVIDIGQPMGFVVDRVASVVGVDVGQIEGTAGIGSTVNTDLLSGLIKNVGGHAMVMVLNFEALLAREFAQIAQMANHRAAGMSGGVSGGGGAEEVTDDELHLVSFDVAEQEYAIDIADVQEIVQIPEQIVQVPHAQSHVLGLMTLRNRLLPLVALRRMFGLPERDTGEQGRIVVVAIGGASVGIVVDSVKEVLRVARQDAETMPALLARQGDLADITDICRLDGGKRLVSILSTGNLFRHSAIQEALDTVSDQDPNAAVAASSSRTQGSGDDEQVVVFRLGSEEFGVPIDSVQEIVRVPDVLTHVPKAPSSVEGVINLRGSVLPVVDLRRRLGLPTVARNDGQRIVVFLIQGVRTGFIVDAVAEVLKVPRQAIEPAPQLSSEQATLLARMANLEKQKRMLQLIDPAYLLGDGELNGMAAMAA
ncbi:chemotaxis protein CheW [Ideonella livida]|uniref:Chemotaxis protein CheW n=1 Tax=Ideonella livida TaxID=2707176 RepID=A0A7C9PFM4_9BURK|nr:chemotaxis protein CheW [Ideonella livida]NDY90488.1 purine-binding chemotaxis protein CheW [Ideonella livida]